ncbi:MAG: hypothetical protein J7501_15075 [Bdellovibrio sp.]|nr:hypothetical protein [Bdellovibrio sp.]
MAQVWIIGIPLAVGAVLAFISRETPYGYLVVVVGVLGAWLATKSKVGLRVRTGKPVAWAAKHMNLEERKKYYSGWFLIVISFLFSILVHYN